MMIISSNGRSTPIDFGAISYEYCGSITFSTASLLEGIDSLAFCYLSHHEKSNLDQLQILFKFLQRKLLFPQRRFNSGHAVKLAFGA